MALGHSNYSQNVKSQSLESQNNADDNYKIDIGFENLVLQRCGICFQEGVLGRTIVPGACLHVFCEDCTRSYFKMKIENSEVNLKLNI